MGVAPSRLDNEDSSIISEAAPSEMAADFPESRHPGVDAEGFTTGLPVVGAWPLARQQRAMLGLFVGGFVLLLLVAFLALSASNRSAAQVGAAGQATTQSQRLAKSVSQALVGNAAAFPEVQDSVSILARNVRSLKTGEGDVAAAPGALQESVDMLVPLVDRAEKNAAIVLGQQKTLTQVGQALRAINRQSADLLETAETVSSLKLQSGASAAELSAVGQLVMLTQRIGKSANEFLTTEGVSAEAVFLLGKDLNSFREIAQGVLNGNADLRLPGTRDPEVKEKLAQLLTQYEQTRTEASAILGNLQGLVAAREAQTAIVADSEPLRVALDGLQAGPGRLGRLRRLPPGGPAAGAGADGRGRLRPAAPVRDRPDQPLTRGRQPAPRGRTPGAGSQACERRQPGGHSAPDERTADGGRRRPHAAGHGDRRHHRRHRRLGELHRGRTAHPGGAGAGHGGPRDRHHAAGGTDLHRTAGHVDRTAARDSRAPASRCCRWPAESTTCRRRRRKRPRWRASRCAAAETGLDAVQNAIGGMNAIRDQIQDTSKRIKRLGESRRRRSAKSPS